LNLKHQICRLNWRPGDQMSRYSSTSDTDSYLKSAITAKQYSESNLMDEKARQIRSETRIAEQRATLDHADAVRRSLANKYAYGKDCSEDICHPYSVAIKEILWGFVVGEEINPDSIIKYEHHSSQALYNVSNRQVQFLYQPPVVPNLASGLPIPFTVKASNSLLSALNEPYWLWPHIKDPNPGKAKHGRATWECKDMNSHVVATKTVEFKENQDIMFNCNDVATQFAAAVKKEKGLVGALKH
jgi:hypothetical protein